MADPHGGGDDGGGGEEHMKVSSMAAPLTISCSEVIAIYEGVNEVSVEESGGDTLTIALGKKAADPNFVTITAGLVSNMVGLFDRAKDNQSPTLTGALEEDATLDILETQVLQTEDVADRPRYNLLKNKVPDMVSLHMDPDTFTHILSSLADPKNLSHHLRKPTYDLTLRKTLPLKLYLKKNSNFTLLFSPSPNLNRCKAKLIIK